MLAIIGAGIAGLASAAACERSNMPYQLFDAADDALVGGAALTLWPNALAALNRLGLLDQFPNWMGQIENGDVRTHRNDPLYQLPINWLKRHYGYLPTCVRRSDFTRWIWERVCKPNIHRSKCVGITHEPNGVLLHFSNGDCERFDGAIAADGIHSVVRRKLYEETTYRSTHYTAWRGIAETHQIQPSSMREFWGAGARFGYATIDPSNVYWFATINNRLLPRDRQLWPSDLARRLQQFPADVDICLANTPESSIFQHSVQDLTPGTPMAYNHVALIGDAAHAITPNLGLGACLALEDAAALSDCFKHGRTVQIGFQTFAALRRNRVARIARLTRILGNATQLESQAAILMRNQLIALLPRPIEQAAWRMALGDNKL